MREGCGSGVKPDSFLSFFIPVRSLLLNPNSLPPKCQTPNPNFPLPKFKLKPYFFPSKSQIKSKP